MSQRDPQPGEFVTLSGPPRRHPDDQPTAAPTRKVTAATTGGGIGAAVAVLLLGQLSRMGWELSPEEASAASMLVAAAITVGLPTIGAFISGYMVRERAP